MKERYDFARLVLPRTFIIRQTVNPDPVGWDGSRASAGGFFMSWKSFGLFHELRSGFNRDEAVFIAIICFLFLVERL
jgi:hypothetical protein